MRSVLIEQPAASDTIKKFRNATSEGKKALLVFPVLRVKSLMWLSEYKTAAAYGQALNFRIREDVGKGDLHAWAHCCRLLGDVTTLQKEPHLALYAAHLFVNECSEFSKPILPYPYSDFLGSDHIFVAAQKQILQLSLLLQACTFFLKHPEAPGPPSEALTLREII